MYNKLQTRREVFKSLFKMLQFSEQLFLEPIQISIRFFDKLMIEIYNAFFRT